MDLSVLIHFYSSPVMQGVLLCIAFFMLFALVIEKFPNAKFTVCFDMLFEKVAHFYGDILWDNVSQRVKTYIVTLFFVILTANFVWILLDFVAPIFGISSTWDFYLTQYIIVPTADMQFNIALSIFSTLLLIYIQFQSLWIKNFFLNYFPITGKWYLTVSQWNKSLLVYYPTFTLVKIADICLSLFLGFLEIVWLFAKVISLAFRLFWNMTSGTVLLWMLVVGTTAFSNSITEFVGGIDFPVLFPIIVYLQELLVACIQAMVFPLLVAIFIKMAVIEQEESAVSW